VEGAIAHAVAAHRQIFAAVRERDGGRARRLMRDHLGRLRRDIVVGAFAPRPEVGALEGTPTGPPGSGPAESGPTS